MTQPTNLSTTSRYNFCQVIATYDANGALLEPIQLGLRQFLANTNYSDNTTVNPVSGDTVHQLAWKALGSSDLFWAICDYSNILDPFADIIADVNYFYLGNLLVDIPAGTLVSFTMTPLVRALGAPDGRAQNVARGDKLLIEDLNPSNEQSTLVTVISVNVAKNQVIVSPVPTAFIGTTFSRVRKVVTETLTLTVPNINRVYLEVLDFANPLAITNTE